MGQTKTTTNQQDEVGITIPEIKEKVYTEDEVWELCLRAYHLGGIEEHAPKVSITKWFDKNKK